MGFLRTRTIWEKILGEPKTPIEKLGDMCLNILAFLLVVFGFLGAVATCIAAGLFLPVLAAAVCAIALASVAFGAGVVSGAVELLGLMILMGALLKWVFF